MKSYKIIITNPIDSQRVQEKAFRLGSSWLNGKVVTHTEEPFLYIEGNNRLSYGTVDKCFLEDDSEPISVEDFLNLPEPDKTLELTLAEIAKKFEVDWVRIINKD